MTMTKTQKAKLAEVASLRSRLSAVEAETAKAVAALEDMRVQRDVRQQYGDRMKDERDLFRAHCERLSKALTEVLDLHGGDFACITNSAACDAIRALKAYRKDTTP